MSADRAPEKTKRLKRLWARRSVRCALAALAGAFVTLTLPPFDVLPALAGYSALLWLIMAEEGARRPHLGRFLVGAAFGFGGHLMGLWWVGAAFLVEADRYGALLPVAVLGLPLLLAPFMGVAAVLSALASPTLAWRAVGLAVAVSFVEVARGVVLTGFPWNGVGVQVTQSALLAQGAAVVGVSGLAIVAVLLGALPAALFERRSRWLGAPVGLILAALAVFGAFRLWTAPPTAEDAPRVRIVQPNIPQHLKWAPQERLPNWQTLLTLTAGDGGAPDIVLWPETAIPFLYRPGGMEQVMLTEALAGATLITGAAEIETTAAGRRTFNAVLTVGPDGVVNGRYNKVRLVPFGETVPLAGLLERVGLTALAAGGATFAPGEQAVRLDVPGVPPFQPLICYEVIFSTFDVPGDVAFIANVTNDAWFGDTPGPRQHLRHAALRAIERGVPVLRAANTGISAVFDAQGRQQAVVPLGVAGALDAPLPAARGSLYQRLGDAGLVALWLICGLFGVARVVRRRRIHVLR
ncbi:MAG: apolipoprotein N-acyltransferase [Pseudomonadota bacterium]